MQKCVSFAFFRKLLNYSALLLLVGGCGQPRCGQGGELSLQKKILRVNCSKSPLTLDPRKIGDHISSTLGFMLFEGATRMSEESTHSPGLANMISVDDEGLVYTFELKEAFWSDGSLITAEDFARSWLAILDPNFPAPSCQLLYSIQGAERAKKGEIPLEEVGIKILGPRILEITLEHPTPFFLDLTSFVVLFPLHEKMENKTEEIARKDPNSFICSGPFRLKKYIPDKEILLEKNPFYWDKDVVCLDEIHISLFSHDASVLQMYEKGSLDLVGLAFSQIPKDAVPSLKGREDFKYQPIGATSLCQFNTQSFPFCNKNLRKAIALAINRREIVDHVTLLDEKVATSIIPPLLKGGREDSFFKDGSKEEAKEYLAKALEELGCTLEEIGEIPYLYTLSDLNNRLAQVISRQVMETLGIALKPQGSEFKIFLDKLRQRTFLMSQSAWLVQYNDMMSILDRFKEEIQPTNDPGWENPLYKKLLEASYLCKTDSDRLELLYEAESLFMEDMPQTPLFHWNYAYLIKPYVRNLYISPIGSVHFTHVDLIKEEPLI